MATTILQQQGSPSQQAASQLHLERREDWRYVRIDGTRYVILPSGRSNRTYTVRADGAGCSCRWYARTLMTCSHMLSVREANAEQQAPAPAPARPSYADLFPPCASGCGDLSDGGYDGCCYRCASDEAERLDQDRRAAYLAQHSRIAWR